MAKAGVYSTGHNIVGARVRRLTREAIVARYFFWAHKTSGRKTTDGVREKGFGPSIRETKIFELLVEPQGYVLKLHGTQTAGYAAPEFATA